jgi:hypothetical protein
MVQTASQPQGFPFLELEPRYAIYFVPAQDTNLYRFGASILGYDCYTGGDLSFAGDLEIEPGVWTEMTEDPRRYGFHATLKAPFYLSPSCTEAQLSNAVANFAAIGRTAPSFKPTIRLLKDFIAIVPRRRQSTIDKLASDCVTLFDAYRAPMSPQERARRVATGLNVGQIGHLDRWGYPYLFEDFRFHMTLTGRISVERRDVVMAALEKLFARSCGDTPIAIDQLTLLRQDNPKSRFRVISHARLG